MAIDIFHVQKHKYDIDTCQQPERPSIILTLILFLIINYTGK